MAEKENKLLIVPLRGKKDRGKWGWVLRVGDAFALQRLKAFDSPEAAQADYVTEFEKQGEQVH